MLRAIEIAKANPEHPFGAVIADNEAETVFAEGVNRSSENPIMHGEIDAINNCAATGSNDWQRLTLYSTAEPCPMCMSAILWSGISCVVFGTSIPTLKQLGWDQIDIRADDVIAKSHRPDCRLIPAVLGADCDSLFRRAMRDPSE